LEMLLHNKLTRETYKKSKKTKRKANITPLCCILDEMFDLTYMGLALKVWWVKCSSWSSIGFESPPPLRSNMVYTNVSDTCHGVVCLDSEQLLVLFVFFLHMLDRINV